MTTLVFWWISGWVRQNERNVGRCNLLVRLMCSLQLEEMLTKEEMPSVLCGGDGKSGKTVDRAVLGQSGKVSNTIIPQPQPILTL